MGNKTINCTLFNTTTSFKFDEENFVSSIVSFQILNFGELKFYRRNYLTLHLAACFTRQSPQCNMREVVIYLLRIATLSER